MSESTVAAERRTDTDEASIENTTGVSPTAADLTKFQVRILGVLSARDDAPKGLAIKHDLEGYYGVEINHGRLYPNLNELADLELIEKGKKDERTNSYRLTARGKSVISEEVAWLVERTDGFEEVESA